MIDKIITKVVEEQIPEDNVAVLLSGGVDSQSVAFAAHRLGKNITAYTMYVDGNPSKDAQHAISVAEHFGWGLDVIDVPIDLLVEDFKQLVKKYDCKKKTQVECTWPFLYVYPRILEKVVLSGWAADGYYGLSKRCALHFKEPKEKFDEFRDGYFGGENVVGINQQYMLSEEYGKRFVAPYMDQRVKDYMYQFDWFEMNNPYQKHVVVEAFPEFKEIKVRKHESLQLAAGVPEIFESLLDNPDINLYNRQRTMDLIRDWQDVGPTLF